MKAAVICSLTLLSAKAEEEAEYVQVPTVENLYVYNHSPGWSMQTNYLVSHAANGDYVMDILQII